MKIKLLLLFTYLLVIFVFVSTNELQSAYIEKFPVKLKQPDGTVLPLYVSGDEFYNWIHDSNDYTIIQNPETGWYVYGIKEYGRIVPSKYKVNSVNPSGVGIKPHLITDRAIIVAENKEFRESMMMTPPGVKNKDAMLQATGTINNIVVFIRFSDDPEFTDSKTTYNSMFNRENYNSLKQYYKEVSYNQLTINSHFYPATTGTTVISYQDAQPRGYYQPYSSTNTIGYTGGNNGSQRRDREHILLRNAVNYVNSSIPSNLDLDNNNDGYVDNVCFIVYGTTTTWASLLWPHMWVLYSQTANINGKRVWRYNFQIRSHLVSSGNGVLAHEMFHTIGAPDLYHYSYDGIRPVWKWDLMERNLNPPQHMGAYMKYKYGGWISSIPEITEAGTYTLSPLTSPTNNCYKISSPRSTSEYFIIEYRRKSGRFDNSLPGSGLIIYRINPAYNGNASGPPDEVYVYRLDGTTNRNGNPDNAFYSQQSGRIAINNNTNPKAFLTNGSDGDLNIDQISEAGNTISFRVNLDVGGRPRLKSPPSGMVEAGLKPTLEWYPYSGANSYIFELSEYSDFHDNIVHVEDYSQTSYTITNDLNMNTRYYWRVRAKIGSIFSDWSDVWQFTTARGITTNEVAGTFCGGGDVTVHFNASSIFQPGNFYTVQLSDTMGLFFYPTELGTIQSNQDGDLEMTVTLPDTIPTGYHYKFRVVADNPAVKGSATDDYYLITTKLDPVISDIGDTVCLHYINRYFTANLSYLDYKWTIMGGYIIGRSDTSYVDVIWDKPGRSWLKVVQIAITGCNAYMVKNVEVIDNPVAEFEKADTNVCAGGSGFYMANDENNYRTEMIIEHGRLEKVYSKYHIKVKWDTVGRGRIILIQYNQGGCPDTVVANVQIADPPEAFFVVEDTVCGTIEQTYTTIIKTNEICQWEVSNGIITSDDNKTDVTVKWNERGIGVLKLTVINDDSKCESKYEKAITLLPNPRAEIYGNNSGCLQREGIFTYRKDAVDSLALWYVNGRLQADAKDTLFCTFDVLGTNTIVLKRITKNGCNDSGYVEIEVSETPVPPVIRQSADSIISNTPDGNVWFYNDEEIQNENGQYLMPQKSGRYSAKVENGNSCRSDMSNYIDVIVGNVSDISESTLFSIYPTVTENNLNLRFNTDINSKISIQISDLLDNVLINRHLESAFGDSIEKFDLSDLSQGGYFIKIRIDNNLYVGKILIVK
jgi:M6 family metalloprotease-like protein